VQQPGADLRLAAPRQLVREHHVADPQPGRAGLGEEFLAGAERVPHRGAVGHDGGVALVILVHHEPAADRVVLAPQQLVPAGVERAEDHPVAVELQPLAPVQHDVVVDRERDGMLARQPERSVRADGLDARLGRDRVDQVRLLALEAEDDRLDAAVPVTGRAERAEELAADAGDLAQHAVPA
jgi:hypothetical protein